jgi:Cu2+-exporting ATPase
MDSLVTTGTLVAFLYSMFHTFFPTRLQTGGMSAGLYYESAVVIINFVLLGRFLEDRARRSASASLRKLGGLQPKVVTIERENESFDLPFSLILPGDKVSVKPGDKIPVDGTVESGYSMVDESSISGEPLPVPKEAGQFVYAGTLNQSGLLIVKAEKPGNDTLLAQIIRLVDEAQSSKPPIQKLVDKITQYFVPSIFLIAIITFISWWILGSLNQAIISGVSVLIIACPCALGLATPAALVAGMGRGAKEGLLIRNSAALEIASRINVLFMDKTGTITSGKPMVNNIHWYDVQHEEYWNTILMLESASSHPLATAITTYIKEQQAISIHHTDKADIFEEKAGQGIYAVVNGIEWHIGSAGFLNDQGINLTGKSEQGVTKVYVLRNHKLLADLSISDSIRPDAATMVHHLKREGIEPVMVSGDSQEAAEYIARQAGIDKVYAGILPDRKGELVKKYQSENYKVAMIGDGINDAYALAQADLAFAMGSGSDIAMETSSIVLIKSSLSNVIKSLVLSKALIRIIRQNLFWAFFYNIIAIPLAAGIFYPFTGYMLDPMIAGAAMAMSSITVVGNSLRLRKIKLLIN